MSTPVFVLGCGSNGYGVIRSLARFDARLEIVGIDYDRTAPGLSSRYLSRSIIVPRPAADNKCIETLIALAGKHRERPVAIITTDLFLSLFNDHRAEAERHFLFNIPSQGLLQQILNKRTQYELMAGMGVALPRTLHIAARQRTANISGFRYPAFVKGAFPYLWKEHFAEKGFVVNTPAELEQRLAAFSALGLDVVLQELIVGPNKNHYKVNAYVDRQGSPKAFFTTQKTRQFPSDFGVGSYMVSVRVEELIDAGKRIFGALQYAGVGSIEFKKDERDGKFKFIELNPRMWQQNYQAAVAGLNFAEYYYRDCIGGGKEYSERFMERVSYMDAVNDLQSFMVNKKMTGESYLGWIKQLGGADCYSFFELRDVGPILKSSQYGTRIFRYMGSFFRKMIAGMML